ncbi:hypothetical protein ACFT9I_20775 [Streptomyces sp. NPDC057137]|uniref:hypothetical protein n=1 Tax=Streptomyces sp. NPDC057137 TaxID=3346030 RepID=UPI003633E7CA
MSHHERREGGEGESDGIALVLPGDSLDRGVGAGALVGYGSGEIAEDSPGVLRESHRKLDGMNRK